MSTTENHHNSAHGAWGLVADFLATRPGDKVLLTTDSETDPKAIDAIVKAVRACGATPTLFPIPQLPFQGSLADPYVSPALASIGRAHDIWIDLTFPYLTGSAAFTAVMADKHVRYYQGADIGFGGMERIFGAVDLDIQAELNRTLDRFVASSIGATARITCPKGTDVTFKLDKPAFEKPRRALNPGNYFTPSPSALFPVLDSVQGEIVFAAIYHEYYTALPDPLKITVDATVRSIDGPASQKAALDRALRRAGKGEYGYIIHFTHAVSPTARFTGRSFIEDSRVLGSNAVGMGLPWWVPGGGENHPDGVVAEQSLWIDGQQIVKDGLAIWPPEAADLVLKLVPKVPEPLFHQDVQK